MADTPDQRDDGPDPATIARFVADARDASNVGPCLDPSTVAAHVERRLLDAEHDVVERHLAACDGCRAEVVSLLGDAAFAPSTPRRGRLRTILFAAAAAAAVFVLAVVILRGPDARPTEVALVDAARSLAAARPDLFGDFRPLAADEALPPALSQKRGAALLLAPAGKVLETRPAFRWEQVPGVSRWKVTFSTAEGDFMWSSDASSPSRDYPENARDLERGERYIWEAAGDGPLGRERGRRAFDVASEEERAAFDAASDAIEKDVAPKLRALVLAQWALRHGLYLAAEDGARRFVEAQPGDALGLATLAAARRALGADEPR